MKARKNRRRGRTLHSLVALAVTTGGLSWREAARIAGYKSAGSVGYALRRAAAIAAA